MAIKKLSMAPRTEAPANPVVNAVEDEALREEVALIVAATGRDCVQETVPPVAAAPVAAQALTSSSASPPVSATASVPVSTGAGVSSALWRRAPAVFVDASAARRLAGRPHCEGAIFLVRSDTEAEDTQVAKVLAPVYSASLPADNVDIVELLGRAEVRPDGPRLSDFPHSSSLLNHQHTPASPASADVITAPSTEPVPNVPATTTDSTATCLMVVPAVGGAGASITAAASALVLSRERPICLVDADALAGGIDLVLGMETEPGLRWQDFSAADGRLDGAALYEALPSCPRSPALKVLTWTRSRTPETAYNHASADTKFDSADRPGRTDRPDDVRHIASTISCLIHAGITVIVDCPKQVEYVTTLGALADDTVIILPTSVRAIAAGGHLASVCAQAGFTPSLAVRHQQHRDISVEEVEYALDLPIAGEIEYCKKVAHEIDVGGLAGAVGKLTRGLEAMFALVGGGGDG
ncbi:hypothetical protein [Corynebacterium amycolatum]|uniref:hypothetical protein n=1 Tax=Corynebacterium amycolatum TaxID=43765 RepID=UPI000E135FB6|nr:hypothetical protein [Corynebacterium amycolatum]STB96051.1 Pilus assembly protein CpaE [Corynebacterium amycolatum]